MGGIYRRQVAGLVIQLAKDDPELVLTMIGVLRQAGEIESDDLTYLEALARKWIRIARENRKKGRRAVGAVVEPPSPHSGPGQSS